MTFTIWIEPSDDKPQTIDEIRAFLKKLINDSDFSGYYNVTADAD